MNEKCTTSGLTICADSGNAAVSNKSPVGSTISNQIFMSNREKGGLILSNTAQSNQRGWSLMREMDYNQIETQSLAIIVWN